jgi:hypothetical protein
MGERQGGEEGLGEGGGASWRGGPLWGRGRDGGEGWGGGVVGWGEAKRANVPIEFRDMMEEIMECRPRTLALHLKIAAWHEDILQLGQSQRLALGDLKTILVPRQGSDRPYSRDWIRRASSRSSSCRCSSPKYACLISG